MLSEQLFLDSISLRIVSSPSIPSIFFKDNLKQRFQRIKEKGKMPNMKNIV